MITNFKTYLSKGFTLIELLVVISILGLLTALILPNMVGMRERARDSQKKKNLNELKTALRIFYNDFQTYPTSSDGAVVGCGTRALLTACTWGGSFVVDSTTYMNQLPEISEDVTYLQQDSGDGFLLSVVLDNASDQEVDTADAVGSSGARCGITVQAEGTYYVCAN